NRLPYRNHLVADADVGEGAPSHDPVVPPAGAVRVEVPGVDTVILQVFPGRAVGCDGTGRGDVVGGDGVFQQGQRTGAFDFLNRFHFGGEADEEGRFLNVGGFFVPLVQLTLGG